MRANVKKERAAGGTKYGAYGDHVKPTSLFMVSHSAHKKNKKKRMHRPSETTSSGSTDIDSFFG